jgi:hypothetical protein
MDIMKIAYDVLALLACIAVSTAFVYGLEVAGLHDFLTSVGYWDHNVIVPPSDG